MRVSQLSLCALAVGLGLGADCNAENINVEHRGSTRMSLKGASATAVPASEILEPQPKPPLFLQCDPKWGSDQMGVKGPGEQATICKEGCAMTSLTMALNGMGLYIHDKQLDPGVLNKWLQENSGYVCDAGDCNNLVLDAPERIPGSPLIFVNESEKPDLNTLADWAKSPEVRWGQMIRTTLVAF